MPKTSIAAKSSPLPQRVDRYARGTEERKHPGSLFGGVHSLDPQGLEFGQRGCDGIGGRFGPKERLDDRSAGRRLELGLSSELAGEAGG